MLSGPKSPVSSLVSAVWVYFVFVLWVVSTGARGSKCLAADDASLPARPFEEMNYDCTKRSPCRCYLVAFCVLLEDHQGHVPTNRRMGRSLRRLHCFLCLFVYSAYHQIRPPQPQPLPVPSLFRRPVYKHLSPLRQPTASTSCRHDGLHGSTFQLATGHGTLGAGVFAYFCRQVYAAHCISTSLLDSAAVAFGVFCH